MRKKSAMFARRKAQVIARLLDDPLIRIVMRADGVDPQALARDLQRLRIHPKTPATTHSRGGQSAALQTSFASPAKRVATPCGACPS